MKLLKEYNEKKKERRSYNWEKIKYSLYTNLFIH